MYQALLTLSFLDLRLCTILSHTQNLVIILGLAPLQRRLGFLEFRLERPHFGDTIFELCLLQRSFKVSDGTLEILEVQVDPSSRS